jgi:hypothetical protein
MNIGLVAAGLEQVEGPLEAKRLYASLLFQLSADYCRRYYHRWFVLSWEYRSLGPEEIVLRSEEVQACRGPMERRRWLTSGDLDYVMLRVRVGRLGAILTRYVNLS